MADTKISALTALTGANVEHTADSIPLVDDSVTTTKRILVSELAKALEVLATEQATTSGTEIDFTSIPAWVKRITIMFDGVSLSTSAVMLVQLGDSGGFEATGYTSTWAYLEDGGGSTGNTNTGNETTGFAVGTNAAGDTVTGHMIITLMDSANNTWIESNNVLKNTGETAWGAGSKSLSGALTQVRITGGTFDAGAVNIMYE